MNESDEFPNIEHSLSESDFNSPLQTPPQAYNENGPVTRENFVPMLINSFAISQANESRHALYFDWLQARTGFDYKRTIQSFLQTGGLNVLSETEQAMFKHAFHNITKHHSAEEGEVMRDFEIDASKEVAIALDSFIEDRSFKETRENLEIFIRIFGPTALMSKKDFLRNLDQFISQKLWKTSAEQE